MAADPGGRGHRVRLADFTRSVLSVDLLGRAAAVAEGGHDDVDAENG